MVSTNEEIFAHIQQLTSRPIDESEYLDIWLFTEDMDPSFVADVIVPHCMSSDHFCAFEDRVLLAPFDEELQDGEPHDFSHPRCLLANNVSIERFDLESLPERFLDTPYLKNLRELVLHIEWADATWEYFMQWEGLQNLPRLILTGSLTEEQKSEIMAKNLQDVRILA